MTEDIPPRYHLLPEETTQHVDVEYNKTAIVTFTNAPYGSCGWKNGATPATPLRRHHPDQAHRNRGNSDGPDPQRRGVL